ncbi:hypothetical protein G7085_12600 [Tessaracoccus sp. HDW20]|uniref:LCP family protein n=1 Tax=Tessaracoccus coleopterorum TaxID=2714950 RepID=UPI0018D47A58|nr:hypothetical protein [Tessaracoccus coleopterorum]
MRPSSYIEKGENRRLGGYQAMWYARSRYDSSDYDRMARQSCLVDAIIRQANPQTLVTSFEPIAAASAEILLTDVTRDEFGAFIDLAFRVKDGNVNRLVFVPGRNGYSSSRPDFDEMRSAVATAIAPLPAVTPPPLHPPACPPLLRRRRRQHPHADRGSRVRRAAAAGRLAERRRRLRLAGLTRKGGLSPLSAAGRPEPRGHVVEHGVDPVPALEQHVGAPLRPVVDGDVRAVVGAGHLLHVQPFTAVVLPAAADSETHLVEGEGDGHLLHRPPCEAEEREAREQEKDAEDREHHVPHQLPAPDAASTIAPAPRRELTAAMRNARTGGRDWMV